MPVVVSPTESDIQAALRSFCLSVLPAGVDCIEQLDNRVPEPQSSNFVAMTPMRRVRLATNLQVEADCSFTASIAGAVMTVTELGELNQAAIAVGASVVGPGVPLAVITKQTSGATGGLGTYMVSPSYTAGPGTFAAGQLSVVEMVETAIQLGFHSADNTGSDMAQAVRQMLRDPYAVRFIQAINPAIAPLYGSDARLTPFINAEDQFEWRWVVEAVLQANVTLSGLSQDFVTTLALTLIDVDVVYPPGGIFTLDSSVLDGPDVLG
jgi:hypothetical protein